MMALLTTSGFMPSPLNCSFVATALATALAKSLGLAKRFVSAVFSELRMAEISAGESLFVHGRDQSLLVHDCKYPIGVMVIGLPEV